MHPTQLVRVAGLLKQGLKQNGSSFCLGFSGWQLELRNVDAVEGGRLRFSGAVRDVKSSADLFRDLAKALGCPETLLSEESASEAHLRRYGAVNLDWQP